MDLAEIIRRVLELSQAAETRGVKVDEAMAAIKKQATELHTQLHEVEQRGVQLAAPARLSIAMQRRAAIQSLLKGREAELAVLATQRGLVTLRSATPLATRALVSSLGDSPGGTGGYPVAPVRDQQPFWTDPARPLTLLDAIEHLPMSAGNLHEGVRLIDPDSPPTPDQGAAVQANEGDLKAERELIFQPAQTAIDTVAVFTVVSTQLLNDAPLLFAAISDLFSTSVASKAERLAVAQLFDEAPVYTSVATDTPDKISEVLASLEAAGYSQPLVLLHPFTWHQIRTQRASGGSEEYLAGSWASPPQANTWGAPVIRNAAVAQGELLVTDRTAVRYLDRQLPVVEVSTQDNDNFRRNLATIRAEARGAIEVTRPGGLLRLSIGGGDL